MGNNTRRGTRGAFGIDRDIRRLGGRPPAGGSMHTVYGGVGGNKDQPSAPGGDRAITYFDPYRPRAGDKALTYIDPYLPRGSDRALTYIDPYHAQGATTRTAKNPMTQQVLSVVYNPATGQYLDTTARRWLNAPAWMRAQLG